MPQARLVVKTGSAETKTKHHTRLINTKTRPGKTMIKTKTKTQSGKTMTKTKTGKNQHLNAISVVIA